MYGNVIVISYGNVDVYYCGLGSTALVEAGENVIAGQDIGSVNTIPCESIEAPHLHLEMKKDGASIDPSTLLPKGTRPALVISFRGTRALPGNGSPDT